MKIKFLGVGSGLSTGLGNTSFVVNDKVLVDCGFTVPEALKKYDLLDKIEAVIITHIHSDHVGGLEMLGFYNYFVRKERIELTAPPKLLKPLWKNCLKGGMRHIQNQHGAPLKATLSTYFDAATSRGHALGKSVVQEYLVFRFNTTPHVPEKESYCLSIEDSSRTRQAKNGHLVYYSSDTSSVNVEEIKDHALTFHDCQLFHTGKGDVHTSYKRLLKEVPDELKNRVWLVHYGDADQAAALKKDCPFAGFVKPGQEFNI